MGDRRVDIFHLQAEMVDLVAVAVADLDMAAAAAIEIEAENPAIAQEVNLVPTPSTSR
ncbi:hypothetical protein [Mesorhizobium sp. B4-1-3]|uniref:hypothetical protein n=1 Tax=Mesorhizobium sp. B4-1-3 TaxID=2589889 RepID=UPI001FEFB7E8|nr:hypothetical protein [Mesorhizobium sp. B4-1-3]